MFKPTHKHMKGDHRSVAEEFHDTKEDEFKPSLEKVYWDHPNKPRSTTMMTSEASGYCKKSKHSEGL